jgi:hypothetical protein
MVVYNCDMVQTGVLIRGTQRPSVYVCMCVYMCIVTLMSHCCYIVVTVVLQWCWCYSSVIVLFLEQVQSGVGASRVGRGRGRKEAGVTLCSAQAVYVHNTLTLS